MYSERQRGFTLTVQCRHDACVLIGLQTGCQPNIYFMIKGSCNSPPEYTVILAQYGWKSTVGRGTLTFCHPNMHNLPKYRDVSVLG